MNEVNAETNNTVTGEQPLYSIKVKTTIEDYTWAVKANMYTEKPSGIFLTLSFLLGESIEDVKYTLSEIE